MADGYLGEFPVDVADSPYGDFGPAEYAMLFIERYGQVEGEHHKAWVLDQVSRILKGTPVVIVQARWTSTDPEYRFKLAEPSAAYEAWVDGMLGGKTEDGEREYGYEVGVAP